MTSLTIPLKRFNSYRISSILACVVFFILLIASSIKTEYTFLFIAFSTIPLYFLYKYGKYLLFPTRNKINITIYFNQNEATIIKQDIFEYHRLSYCKIVNVRSYDRIAIDFEWQRGKKIDKGSIDFDCKDAKEWEEKIHKALHNQLS